mmetsp:Transcript_107614/g.343458  ORF Transcript_107614/g.343458 Transcript_107614/m.343458 type:complete len:210 (+) Transcript_107614:333-962(+)
MRRLRCCASALASSGPLRAKRQGWSMPGLLDCPQRHGAAGKPRAPWRRCHERGALHPAVVSSACPAEKLPSTGHRSSNGTPVMRQWGATDRRHTIAATCHSRWARPERFGHRALCACGSPRRSCATPLRCGSAAARVAEALRSAAAAHAQPPRRPSSASPRPAAAALTRRARGALAARRLRAAGPPRSSARAAARGPKRPRSAPAPATT